MSKRLNDDRRAMFVRVLRPAKSSFTTPHVTWRRPRAELQVAEACIPGTTIVVQDY